MTGLLPYPGLRAFARDESHLFFGRDGCVDAMITRLAATRFLAVLGASGSGKSSLVRTGLLDGLELGFYARAGARWRVVDMHPGGAPLRNLAAALVSRNGAVPATLDVDVMRALLARGPRSIAQWCAAGALQPGENLLIMVDQFEELFRYGDYAAREEAEAFVALLLESARAPGAALHVVLTMRSEYLGACSLIPGLAEQINAGFYLTPRMNRDECRQAIEGPAAVAGFDIEPALVNQVLNDVASFAPWEDTQGVAQSQVLSRRADQLPLMQHLLNRLWLAARAEQAVGDNGAVRLTIAHYRAAGGLAGALDAHGAEVMASLAEQDRPLVEPVFRALVSGPDTANAVRRPCQFMELASVAGNAAAARRIVERFRAADCNFLQPPAEIPLEPGTVVDISHESLIRQWAKLAGWLNAEARADANWRRLVDGAQRWERGEGGLLTGLDLNGQSAWWDAERPTEASAARHGGGFAAAAGFLMQSRAAGGRARQRERKTKLALIGLVALLFLASTGMAVKWRDSSQAQKTAEYAERLAKEKERAAKAAEQRALDDARTYAKLIVDLQKIIFSTHNTNLLGSLPLLKELGQLLQPTQQRIAKNYSGVVTPSQALATQKFLAFTLENSGDAAAALSERQAGFLQGLDALRGMRASDPDYDQTAAETLAIGYWDGWLLFDIGEDAAGEDVIKRMGEIAATYTVVDAPPVVISALARYERLVGRHASDIGQTDQAIASNGLARKLAERRDAPTEDRETLAGILTTVLSEDSVDQASKTEACDRLEKLYFENTVDLYWTTQTVLCLSTAAAASEALASKAAEGPIRTKKRVESDRLMGEADARLGRALSIEPTAPILLLAKSDLANRKSRLLQLREDWVDQARRLIEAGHLFVDALKDRSYAQQNTDQVATIYREISTVDFSKLPEYNSTAAQINFWRSIRESVQLNRNRFPKAPSYAYVEGNTSTRIAELLLKEGKLVLANNELAIATKAYADGNTVGRVIGFSDKIADACQAWGLKVQAATDDKRADDAIQAYNGLQEQCSAAMAAYPWDFYLRQHFIGVANRLGKLLHESERFEEAIRPLQYASDWGMKESSLLLADIYRNGRSVPPDPAKADTLDALGKRQSMKRFTVPCDFDGVKYPFYVYVMERAPGVGMDGIDDQVAWLKEARGGVVPEDVVTSFHKLQTIARENNVSFPELCVYALGEAQKAAPSPNGGQPAPDADQTKPLPD